MSIVAQIVMEDTVQLDGRHRVRYQYTDHLGKIIRIGPITVEAILDINADLLARIPQVETQLAEQEIKLAMKVVGQLQSPEKIAEHQTQAEFDLKVLARAMQLTDVHEFYAVYPFFQVVEGRGGANANQRATYLGITTTLYNQIATRFNNVSGVAWFLTDEKNQVWNKLPDGIE